MQPKPVYILAVCIHYLDIYALGIYDPKVGKV